MVMALGLALPLSGCVYALHPYNSAGAEKLRIVSARGGHYTVRIHDTSEVSVPTDGRVIVDVPALPRGCSVYVFGLIKIADGSPERVRAIHVLRDGKVARRLSLEAIHGLPIDSEGYRVVKP